MCQLCSGSSRAKPSSGHTCVLCSAAQFPLLLCTRGGCSCSELSFSQCVKANLSGGRCRLPICFLCTRCHGFRYHTFALGDEMFQRAEVVCSDGGFVVLP